MLAFAAKMRNDCAMPTIHQSSNFKIAIFFRDHPPPHFHVERVEGRAAVTIETLEIMAGDLSPRLLREPLHWAAENQDLLRSVWNEFHGKGNRS
ncbi:MAG: DUF4160 domain-containing protein [Geminicoccaceae bacterium]|nr:DUF4160 domain-containing protein [Geminicoccaceae bacterium]